MLTVEFKEDGKLLETVEVEEKNWGLSEGRTYEHTYKAGYALYPNRWGYKYSLWLDRPISKDREA